MYFSCSKPQVCKQKWNIRNMHRLYTHIHIRLLDYNFLFDKTKMSDCVSKWPNESLREHFLCMVEAFPYRAYEPFWMQIIWFCHFDCHLSMNSMFENFIFGRIESARVPLLFFSHFPLLVESYLHAFTKQTFISLLRNNKYPRHVHYAEASTAIMTMKKTLHVHISHNWIFQQMFFVAAVGFFSRFCLNFCSFFIVLNNQNADIMSCIFTAKRRVIELLTSFAFKRETNVKFFCVVDCNFDQETK